jgi:hypothetical protein
MRIPTDPMSHIAAHCSKCNAQLRCPPPKVSPNRLSSKKSAGKMIEGPIGTPAYHLTLAR